jgi:iron complex transport system substrate-binding protein
MLRETAPYPPHIDDLTRREFLIGAGLIALAPSCGSDGEGGEASRETRTVRHFMGESKVPVSPQRITVLDDSAFETALALGVEPVGVPTPESIGYLGEKVPEGARSIGGNYAPDLERIALLEPDVIVGNEYSAEEIYEELSQIAPTVVAEFGEFGDRWKIVHSKTAEALGLQEEGERVLDEYEARTRRVREAIGDPGTIEVSLVRAAVDANFSVYGTRSFCGSVVEEVGLSRPEQQRDEDGLELSLERLDLAEGDVMFVFTFGAEEDDEFRAELTEKPLFRRLDVAQRGEVYEVGAHWLYAGPVSANRILDDLERYLVDGSGG